MAKKTSNEIYQEVSDHIVAALREGIVPWRRDFTVEGGLHRSFSTHKAYRGINQFTLPLVAMMRGYKSPFWITMNQIKKNEGKLKKINKPDEKGTGQKSTMVTFYKLLFKEETDANGNTVEKVIPLLKYFNVFNLDQVEGVDAPNLDASEYTPEERAQSIINGYDGPEVTQDTFTSYDAAADALTLAEAAGYREVFEVLIASTAHSSRLSRTPDFSQDAIYNKEALTQEMGASMLCGLCELPPTDYNPSESYINGWIDTLEDNPRLAVQAASKAQGAADFILGPDEEEEEDE